MLKISNVFISDTCIFNLITTSIVLEVETNRQQNKLRAAIKSRDIPTLRKTLDEFDNLTIKIKKPNEYIRAKIILDTLQMQQGKGILSLRVC